MSLGSLFDSSLFYTYYPAAISSFEFIINPLMTKINLKYTYKFILYHTVNTFLPVIESEPVNAL
jgi:hypothetical protein